MTLPKIENYIRPGTPQVGVRPYGQVHAHSTGNRGSTAQNEADYHMRRPIESGFFSHVVGNGRVIQTAPVNRGAYDVGGGWNAWGYAQVELIESHKTKAEFLKDYKIYVELLRKLAKDGGIPIKVDAGNTGILSHNYCTYHQPNNGSDHVDPYPYLAKWGISKAQFKKDIEKGISGTPVSQPGKAFDISNYHTTVPAQIKVKRADYAYKEKALKTKVGAKVKAGTILTVTGIEYSGKYPRFKLKSGLYISTRKDIVSIYKAKASSKPATSSKLPAGVKAEKATFVNGDTPIQVRKGAAGLKATKAGILPAYAQIHYDGYIVKDGYTWVHYIGNTGDHLYLPVRKGKTPWGTFK